MKDRGDVKVRKFWDKRWMMECPGCGYEGMIDDAQFHGRVSILCPLCGFHETINLAKLKEEK